MTCLYNFHRIGPTLRFLNPSGKWINLDGCGCCLTPVLLHSLFISACVSDCASRLVLPSACAAVSSAHLGVICEQCGLWWIRNTDLDLIIQIEGVGGWGGDYRSGKTSAPPCSPLPPPPPPPPLPSSSSPCSPYSPHTLGWPCDPLPHITHGSSVRRKGDLTANLARVGPWSWGPGTSQRIPVFSWPPPPLPFPLHFSVPTERQRENISLIFGVDYWGWRACLSGVHWWGTETPALPEHDLETHGEWSLVGKKSWRTSNRGICLSKLDFDENFERLFMYVSKLCRWRLETGILA